MSILILSQHSKSVLKLLYKLLQEFKQAITNRSYSLPFYRFNQYLCPQSLEYKLKIQQSFILTTLTLPRFTRILELITICIQNIENGKTITKRNLFYQLVQYYDLYKNIDKDLKLICYNLSYLAISEQFLEGDKSIYKINRPDLGIIASSRCVLQGRLDIKADQRIISSQNSQIQIKTVPTCRYFEAKCYAQQIIIIEKESMLYELATVFKHHKLHEKYLLISARGYPDQTTRKLLLNFMKQQNPTINRIYYLGDYDVFGFDIFMFYTLGDWFCQGLLPKIQIVQIGNFLNEKIFDDKILKRQMNKFSKQDLRKAEDIKANWFSKTNAIKQYLAPQLKTKLQTVQQYFNNFIRQQLKCQLQLLSLYANNKIWVQNILELQKQKQKN